MAMLLEFKFKLASLYNLTQHCLHIFTILMRHRQGKEDMLAIAVSRIVIFTFVYQIRINKTIPVCVYATFAFEMSSPCKSTCYYGRRWACVDVEFCSLSASILCSLAVVYCNFRQEGRHVEDNFSPWHPFYLSISRPSRTIFCCEALKFFKNLIENVRRNTNKHFII